MQNPEALLIHILRGDRPDGLETLSDAEVEHFVATAQREGVLSLVRHHLSGANALESCTPALQLQLRIRDAQQAALDMARGKENLQVLRRLKNAGLRFILLKGEALARRVYASPHIRTRDDTDILFASKQDAERAWQLLAAEGYEKGFALEGELVGLQFECSKTLTEGIKNYLDIHNSLCNNHWLGNRFGFDELYTNTQPLDYQGEAVKMLNMPYALLHACLHRLSNKPHGTEDKLIWRYDLHLLGREMDKTGWETFLRTAKEKQVAALCLEGLLMAEEAFPDTLPPAYRQPLAQTAREEPNPPTNLDKPWGSYLQNLHTHRSLGDKLKYVWENLAPPPSYIRERYNPTSDLLIPYYYLKRLMDFVAKGKAKKMK